MQISWRLRELLMKHKLDRRGVREEISHDDKHPISRATVSKIYNDEAPAVTLEVLEKLCDWLADHGVPPGELPGALLGKRPAALWKTLAAPRAMRVYLGEYQPGEPSRPRFRWISRRDNDVANKIIQRVTDFTEVGPEIPRVNINYVPFHWFEGREFPLDKTFKYDVDRAARICRDMRKGGRQSSSVLIGSQQVNYLVEHYVAQLFRCRAFEGARDTSTVPIFRGYRDTDPNVPSCFGGKTLPGTGRAAAPGIYYRSDGGGWNSVLWRDGKEDAAIVITSYDRRSGAMVLVILGYSGRATAAAGEHLAQQPDEFWKKPDKGSASGGSIINVCRVRYADHQPADPDADPHVADFEIVRRLPIQR